MNWFTLSVSRLVGVWIRQVVRDQKRKETRSEAMYILRLVSLLRTFRAFGQSGTVSLEPLHDQTEEPWQASLHLYQGEVTSCSVHRKSDKQLLCKGTEAIQWLETKERFFWNLEESSEAVPLSFAPSILPPDHPDRPDDTASSTSQGTHQLLPDKQGGTFPFREGFSSHEQREAPLPLVPQRTEMPAEEALPREHKRIFALVDGHRTSVQIAQLLHCSSQRVVQILCELQLRRLVEL
jgi:hypothetical protein